MHTLLVLNINPELEEELIDYLLELDSVSGFTSYHVNGHGHHASLSIAEQVTGRRKRTQLELLVEVAAVESILAGLASEVGRDIVYWQQPVNGQGRLSQT